MKYAVIDMGSNSIRLMIAEVDGGQLGRVEKHLEMTRLGGGVDHTKMLSETAMQATIDAVMTFKNMAEAAGAEMIGAFATSAVRDAVNGPAFAESVLKETGIRVQIIPGSEEAELGYKGVVSGIDPSMRDERFLIIDIGGGSTELIVGDAKQIYYRHSFDVGAVRMTGKHIATDPVRQEEAEALVADVKRILSDGVEAVMSYKPQFAIGIGGTATTLGAMKLKMSTYDRERIHNAPVQLEELEAMNALLARLTVEERKQLPGLMPKRADVIYAGGLILEYLMQVLAIRTMYASDFDNLEGILVQKNIIKS